jgi:Patatin-like phospholipase
MAGAAVGLPGPLPKPSLRERIAYCYLLRVPLIVAALLVLFPLGALIPGAPLATLFGNLFALGPIATGVTTVCALVVGWSVLLSCRLVLLNGQERFGVTQWMTANRLSGKAMFFAVLIALPAIFGQFFRSSDFELHGAALWRNLEAVAGGFVVAYVVVFLGLLAAVFVSPQGTDRATHSFPAFGPLRYLLEKANAHSIFKESWWENTGKWIAGHVPESWTAGYVDRRTQVPDGKGNMVHNTGYGLPWSGHWVAFCFAMATFALYLGIDSYKKNHLGEQTVIPALAFVLILFLNANWVFSALAFFFDRFRVPLLLPLILLALFGTNTRSSDHYFAIHQGVKIEPVYPYDVLKPRLGTKKPIIIVATAGGGIQASAWTAQVLAGLQLNSKDWGRQPFADSIVLISSVSGGAVGTLFFMNGYGPGTDPQHAGFQLANTEKNRDDLVDMASAASLDDVAWGLVYRDIPRTILPYGSSGSDLLLDRGRMLELSWQNRGKIFADLSNWRTGVKEGWRPAVIFNSTIVETGEPLLLSTTDFGRESQAVIDPKGAQPNRKSLEDLLPNVDVPVVTAVRLAASFPYVAPAARPQQDGPAYHVVDGGYYDNYGVSSVVQWLDQALTAAKEQKTLDQLPPILIVQIRSFPDDALPAPQNDGWFYQLHAPVDGLMSVRTTAQLVRDRDELNLLRDKWGNDSSSRPRIRFAGFKFQGKDAPLSWKMTHLQVEAVKSEWVRVEKENGEDLQEVRCAFEWSSHCNELARKDPW